MSETIEIPEDLQAACKAVAKVAKEHKLNNLSGEFTPGYDSKWRHKIHFSWSSGRHGADSNKLRIWSEYNIYTEIES